MSTTPVRVNYHYHPVMQLKASKQPSSLYWEIQADTFAAGLEETAHSLRRSMQKAQASRIKYSGIKLVGCGAGDMVWLSTRHFWKTRPARKLNYSHKGPYTVRMLSDKNTYKLDLPYTILTYNTFQVSFLNRNTPPITGEPQLEPLLTVISNPDEWDVDWILHPMRGYQKPQYLIQWSGYRYVRTSCEPAKTHWTARALAD
jgi:hypothetical protein